MIEAHEASAKYLADPEPRLLRGFAELATSTGGVSRLRELIRTLAVRGRLLPQDSRDQPASSLLAVLQLEKQRLLDAGAIRRDRASESNEDLALDFGLPSGWELVQLADVAWPQAGFAFKSSAFNESGEGLPLIRIRDVGSDAPTTFFSGEFRHDFIVREGDWLIGMDGEFRVAPWKGPKALLNQRVTRLIFYGRAVQPLYICLALQQELRKLQGTKAYTTVDHLSGGQIASRVIPLPPLAEQQRIVTRIEELLKLCDALEQSGRLADEQHARLTSTLFDVLATSESTHALAESWQRVSKHFDLLLDRPEAVDALEQIIIQLAVEGTLVGRCRSGGEWRQGTLGEVVDFLNGYAFKSEWFRATGVRLVRNVNVSHGSLVWSDAACVEWTVADELSRYALAAGDMVLSLDRPIISTGLKYAVVEQQDLPCLLLQRVARLKPLANVLAREYLELWLNSPQFVGRIDAGRSNGVPHISTRQLQAIPIALPPLAEQFHIVARVEELRLLCGDLRKRIGQARETQTRLADALVAGAA